MEINAIFVGEKWLPYRQAGTEALIVHSVFDRVINISTNKDILSVTAENIGGSSSFLIVPGRALNFGVERGDRAIASSGALRFAGCSINFQSAAVWKGPITKNYRYDRIKRENIEAFKTVLDRKADPQSAWKIVNGDTESNGIKSRFSGLKAILKLRENPLEAQNLVGLGLGLTPSGDDMLTGFMAIVNHQAGKRDYVKALRGTVSGLLYKTTDISAQMLANTLNCDYHEYMQKCIFDLCEGEKESVYISTTSLLTVGATSGSDIACGMYFGMSDKLE